MRITNRNNKYRQRRSRRRRNLRAVSTRKNRAMRRVKNKHSRSRLVVMKHRGGADLRDTFIDFCNRYCTQEDHLIRKVNKFLIQGSNTINWNYELFLTHYLHPDELKIIFENTIPVDDDTISAFHDCEAITKIVIPNNVTKLAESLFSGCIFLRTVFIPKSVTQIGENAFERCVYGVGEDNESFQIQFEGGSLLNEIGKNAFSSSNLHEVELPLYVTSIGEGAFSKCSNLKKVTFPDAIDTLTTLEKGVFFKCKKLKEFQIPKSVESIGNSTFAKSGLTQITFPENIKSIGERAFENCPLIKITFQGNPTYDEIKDAFTNMTTVPQITCIKNPVIADRLRTEMVLPVTAA